MKKIFQDYLFLILVAGVVLFLDQASKQAVRTNLQLDEVRLLAPWLYPYVFITYQLNTGAALSSFSGFGLVFKALAVVVSTVILYFFPRISRREGWLRLSLALTLAGVLGNLTDRLLQNDAVTDFLALGNFAIVNFADISIWAGVVILVLTLVLHEDEKPKTQEAPLSQPEQPKNE